MKNFLTSIFFILITHSIFSDSYFLNVYPDTEFSNAEEEIISLLENSKKNIVFYLQTIDYSQHSNEKYHYWVGRSHSYEQCLSIIKSYQLVEDEKI